MKPKSLEIFIPGPAGRLEAKYYKNPKFGSPVAIVLHPHPQYGGTMSNRIVQLMYNIFLENGFSVIKVNFRGVGKSDGVFDNGQGESRLKLKVLAEVFSFAKFHFFSFRLLKIQHLIDVIRISHQFQVQRIFL